MPVELDDARGCRQMLDDARGCRSMQGDARGCRGMLASCPGRALVGLFNTAKLGRVETACVAPGHAPDSHVHSWWSPWQLQGCFPGAGPFGSHC